MVCEFHLNKAITARPPPKGRYILYNQYYPDMNTQDRAQHF